MPKIVFVQSDGLRREIQAPAGITLMEAARQNGIVGVVAQCGGACACATCHVYIEPQWLDRIPAAEDMEQGMLENAWEPKGNSRLSCQIQLSAELDGLQVRVPVQQSV